MSAAMREYHNIIREHLAWRQSGNGPMPFTEGEVWLAVCMALTDLEACRHCRLKDHEIAALVNALRDIAIKYHDAQQLRERIADLVVPALRGKRSPERSRVNHVPLRTLTDAECEAIGMEFGPTRLAVNYTTLGRRMVNCVVAALQQSSSGITAGAEKPTQVVDSGAAGPTRTGDLLITNQGAETAETLVNQQDMPSAAPADGAQAAQGESSTCEGVTAGLPAWNGPWEIERSAGGWVREIVDRNGAAECGALLRRQRAIAHLARIDAALARARKGE